MIWIYDQASGHFMTEAVESLFFEAYSGQPPHKNVPADQWMHGLGPIPRGTYFFGEPENHPKLGPNAIPLIPHRFNQMFGRGGFWIHGDSVMNPGFGSDGCICLEHQGREKVILYRNTSLLLVYSS